MLISLEFYSITHLSIGLSAYFQNNQSRRWVATNKNKLTMITTPCWWRPTSDADAAAQYSPAAANEQA